MLVPTHSLSCKLNRLPQSATFLLNVARYEKDDDVEDPIKPDDEKWGWTKADGSLIIITAMKKKV